MCLFICVFTYLPISYIIIYSLLYVHIHIYVYTYIFFHLGEETYNLSYLVVTRDLTVKR